MERQMLFTGEQIKQIREIMRDEIKQYVLDTKEQDAIDKQIRAEFMGSLGKPIPKPTSTDGHQKHMKEPQILEAFLHGDYVLVFDTYKTHRTLATKYNALELAGAWLCMSNDLFFEIFGFNWIPSQELQAKARRMIEGAVKGAMANCFFFPGA